ncbi:hypothetical protein [Arachnia propionica]|uniref:Uncharacterized protein n=1 Tax=Arachnia propionica TaxID=1750 RepID=A0A3P1WT52_9ACTN|nr:hypothetical protein [Arachnia propionica]RRD48520.1 hypothetical protein EII35_12350 [Arachnia propionica]
MRPEVVEIPASTPMEQLGKHTLVVFEDRCVVLQREGEEFRVLSTESDESELLPPTPNDRSVGDVMGAEELRQPLRVATLPDGEVVDVALGPRHNLRRNPVLAMILGIVAGLFLMVIALFALRGMLGAWGTVLTGAFLAWLLHGMLVDVFKGRTIMFRMEGRDWALEDLLPRESRGDAARQQVQGVKEEYGRLLTDLPYRVENPALFDASCPATEALTLALFEWDSTWARLDDDALVALGSRVVSAFHAARHHAERVGMDHLPPESRDDARRALGALRIATAASSSAGERAAALAQAVDLLDELALYYLPSGVEVREALNGRRLRQLPGRRVM